MFKFSKYKKYSLIPTPDTFLISQTYCFFLGTDNAPVVLTKWVVGMPMVVMFEAIGLARTSVGGQSQKPISILHGYYARTNSWVQVKFWVEFSTFTVSIHKYRQTDRQMTDRQTDRQMTDRQTDRQTNRQTDRQTDRQTSLAENLTLKVAFKRFQKASVFANDTHFYALVKCLRVR